LKYKWGKFRRAFKEKNFGKVGDKGFSIIGLRP
jgi:hypothetical protein